MKHFFAPILLIVGITSVSCGCTWSLFESAWPMPSDDIINLAPPSLAVPVATPRLMGRATNFAARALRVFNDGSTEKGQMDWANGDFTSVGAIAEDLWVFSHCARDLFNSR